MNDVNDMQLPSDDEEFLAELRSIAMEFDPPPRAYMEYARAALAFGRFDEEIGRLVETAGGSVMGVRSVGGDTNRVEFSFSDLLVSISYTGERVTGSVLPGSPGEVRVVTRTSMDQGSVSATGDFAVDRSESGPFRVVVEVGGRSYSIDWIA